MSARLRDTVRTAALGVRTHIAWQLSSRLVSFALKSFAVRALGPKNYAFAEVRLGLVHASIRPAVIGVRKIALRARSSHTAAALVSLGVILTACVTMCVAAVLVHSSPDHLGPIAISAVGVMILAYAERGMVFATRNQAYDSIFRARAIARTTGSAVMTASVFLLPEAYVGLYTHPVFIVSHATMLLVLISRLAYAVTSVPVVTTLQIGQHLEREDWRLVAVASWQAVFRFLLENGEGIVLDLTCVETVQGSYRLAANVGSLLARFFSEALEEQSFNIFTRLTPAFLEDIQIDVQERKDMRQECVKVMNMALKAALLVSMLIACIGPFFAYSFLRLLYGTAWADNTTAPNLLGAYFVYLVFMAANGVTEAFVSASASSYKLRDESVFAFVLSGLYIMALYLAGKVYSAVGIIAVNCANMLARTVYAIVYYLRFTKQTSTSVLHALPHYCVLVSLLLGNLLCRVSEHFFFRTPPPEIQAFLVRSALHAVSGAVSVAMFASAVYVFERKLCIYVADLRRGVKTFHTD